VSTVLSPKAPQPGPPKTKGPGLPVSAADGWLRAPPPGPAACPPPPGDPTVRQTARCVRGKGRLGTAVRCRAKDCGASCSPFVGYLLRVKMRVVAAEEVCR